MLPSPRRLTAVLLATLAAAPALADPIAPLAPPPRFDSLAVPLPPLDLKVPPVRVVPAPPPIIVVPGQPVVIQPPSRLVPTQGAPVEPAAPAEPESGTDLIGRGVGTILDNVMREMKPTFQQMAEGLDGAAERFGPAMKDLGRLVDDIGNYQAPERLENGDIIIRRKPGAPPPPPVGEALKDLTTPQDDPDQPALANPVPPPPVTPDPNRPQIDL